MLVGVSGKIGSGKDTVGDIFQALSGDFEIKKFADTLKDTACLWLGCTREQLEDREFKEKELGEEWWYTYGRKYNKDILVPIIDMDEDFKTNPNAVIEKLTPRKLLQLLGTDCGRDIIHPNIWVNALFSEYKESKPPKAEEVFDYYHSECVDCRQSFNGYKRQFICNSCYDSHDWFPNWIITDMRFPNELKAVKDRGGISIRVDRDNEQVLKDKGIHIPKHLITPEHSSETALDNAEFDYTIDNNGTIEELIEKVREILIRERII